MRYRVTGYIDRTSLAPGDLAPDAASGLTEEAYENLLETTTLIELDEVVIDAVDDE